MRSLAGDGSQERDFTFVSDAVEAMSKIALESTLIGSTINIGAGKAISIKALAETIIKLTPTTNKGIEYSEPRPGDLKRLLCKSDFAQRRIDYSPRVSLSQGIEEVIRWFRDNQYQWENWLNLETGKNWL